MPWAGLVAAKSSRRVRTRRTGLRRRSAAPATSGSMTTCFPPNAPPSGAAVTRTLDGGRPKIRASSLRVMNVPWVLAITARVPSGSIQAVAACGSRYAWYAQLTRKRPSTIASQRAKASATSPRRSWSRLKTWSEDSSASGSMAATSTNGARGSTSTWTRSTASSAAASVSPMTSATGCPAKTATSRASGSYRRSSPWPMIGRSLAVRTATTPGTARAAVASIARMRACACRLGTRRACARPGTVRSPA